MTKLSMAIAMLAPAGAALVAAPAAQATVFKGVLVDPGISYRDTFTFNDAAVAQYLDANSIEFALLSDQLGNDTVVFATAGSLSGVGIYGVGPTKIDTFAPSVYSGNPASPVAPGVYSGTSYGATLTLSAVPEPEAWALMVAGVAMAGGAARVARRSRQATANA